MFTGLVSECGLVERVEGRSLHIASTFTDLELGESVACDGVCLTVDQFPLRVTLGDETLARTTLGSVKAGDRIHLERALRLGDRLGGHWVQGHVDGVGAITEIEGSLGFRRIHVAVPDDLKRYFVQKGSVCLSGVSLTINGIDAVGFDVGLIPHTLAVTRLGESRVGDRLNVEVDILARYVESLRVERLWNSR